LLKSFVTLEVHVLLVSILRKTLGLKDHRVVRVEGDVEGLAVTLERIARRRLACSGCGKRARVRDRLARRRWRHVPLWGIPVILVYRPARVACPHCGIRVEEIPWASGKSPLSKALVSVLAVWSRRLAWKVVGELFGVSWNTVATAVDRAVEYGLAHRSLEGLLYVGVDEISRRRGHIYHTQVYDLAEKRLLWSGPDRDGASLRRFFESLTPEQRAQIRGVCCDMWSPYVDVIRETVPQAVLVFDRFHLMRHLLNAVNDVRKAEARALHKTHPGLLSGTRYLWLTDSRRLTPKQDRRLSTLEKLNLKTNRAYLLKEVFTTLWLCKTRRKAAAFFDWWFWQATHSRLQPIRKFAWMVRRHWEGILSWFDVPISNGPTEAMNNNAKAVSHRARGYRTPRVFTLAQLHCLGKLPLPPVVHKFS
jgi:transposase